MKLSLAELWNIKAVISKNLLGVDIQTGERKPVKLPIPVSMKRHLRRVLEEIEGEIKIAEPDRDEFIKKWKVYGENKDQMPTAEDEDFAGYEKDYLELFGGRDFAISFSPFRLDLLDNLDEIIPDDIEGLMMSMNEAFKGQQMQVAAEETPSAGEDKGAETPKQDA